jgi:hypothetical protein
MFLKKLYNFPDMHDIPYYQNFFGGRGVNLTNIGCTNGGIVCKNSLFFNLVVENSVMLVIF